MAGEFTPGLSGGQRKMMLFELVCQRVAASSDLLVCLDEPFAGVTEDFVPFIVDRLNALRKTHNVLLVTNDHVHTLTEMADSTITVSAIDRSLVKVNRKEHSREVCLHAVASGKQYAHSAGNQDLWFFFDTEILSNPALFGVFGFTVFAMLLFLLTFWNSQAGQEILVIVALQIVCFFALNPYLIALPDWRNTMREEAEALMHCSVETNLALKSCIVLLLLIAISGCAFGVLNACMDSLDSAAIWAFMLFDSASLTLPFICFGLYSMLPLQVVQIVASLPFLFMIFFSTTFSPGAGVEGVKALRYLLCRTRTERPECHHSGQMRKRGLTVDLTSTMRFDSRLAAARASTFGATCRRAPPTWTSARRATSCSLGLCSRAASASFSSSSSRLSACSLQISARRSPQRRSATRSR